jgi:hypothetical protein
MRQGLFVRGAAHVYRHRALYEAPLYVRFDRPPYPNQPRPRKQSYIFRKLLPGITVSNLPGLAIKEDLRDRLKAALETAGLPD